MNGVGFVTAAASLGTQAVMVRPQRGVYSQRGQPAFAPIVAQAIVEEQSHDKLEIVEHPVEQGSMIADHAFKRPAEVRVQYFWSNSPSAPGLFAGLQSAIGGTLSLPQSALSGGAAGQVKAIYAQLLQLQTGRTLFSLYTGKRKYDNMLVESLTITTSPQYENALALTMDCKEIMFAVVRVATYGQAPLDQMKDAAATASPISLGDAALTDAPAIKNAMDTVSAAANTAIGGLADGLVAGGASLQAAAEAAIPQLEATIAAATAKLPGVLESVSAQLSESIGSLQGAIAGASGALPGIATDAIANITDALSQIGTPFEIPLSPTPQMFSIRLGAN